MITSYDVPCPPKQNSLRGKKTNKKMTFDTMILDTFTQICNKVMLNVKCCNITSAISSIKERKVLNEQSYVAHISHTSRKHSSISNLFSKNFLFEFTFMFITSTSVLE